MATRTCLGSAFRHASVDIFDMTGVEFYFIYVCVGSERLVVRLMVIMAGMQGLSPAQDK
jgi:hypothetical protein